jgi:hypothetical protein
LPASFRALVRDSFEGVDFKDLLAEFSNGFTALKGEVLFINSIFINNFIEYVSFLERKPEI